MSRISFSPYGQTTPYIGESKSSRGRKPSSSNASVSFRAAGGNLAITFTLKGALSGSKGNAYKLMFNRISGGATPRWGIRIYDLECNIYLTTTLTLATAMSGLPSDIAGGGLGGVLQARVSESVNEAFTAATCAGSIRFSGGY